jgi:hypothetical protein
MRMLSASDCLITASASLRSSSSCAFALGSITNFPRASAMACVAAGAMVERAVVDAERNSAEDRDREQVRDGGDRVVDSRGRARLTGRHGIDDGCRQGGDCHGHAEPKHDHRQQEGHGVRACGAGPCQQQEAKRGNRGPDDERRPGAETVEQPAGPARERRHDDREGQEHGAGQRRRIAMHLNQQVGQKEEGSAQASVEQKRQKIDAAECGGAKQAERHHRRAAAAFLPDKSDQQQRAGGERRDDGRMPSQLRRCHQPEHQAAQPGERQRGSAPIEARRGLGIAALRNMSQRNPDRRQRDERIDEEDPAPAGVIDDEPAHERADGRRDRGEAGPGPDRLATLSFAERCPDDRQRAGDQQGGSGALNGAR